MANEPTPAAEQAPAPAPEAAPTPAPEAAPAEAKGPEDLHYLTAGHSRKLMADYRAKAAETGEAEATPPPAKEDAPVPEPAPAPEELPPAAAAPVPVEPQAAQAQLQQSIDAFERQQADFNRQREEFEAMRGNVQKAVNEGRLDDALKPFGFTVDEAVRQAVASQPSDEDRARAEMRAEITAELRKELIDPLAARIDATDAEKAQSLRAQKVQGAHDEILGIYSGNKSEYKHLAIEDDSAVVREVWSRQLASWKAKGVALDTNEILSKINGELEAEHRARVEALGTAAEPPGTEVQTRQPAAAPQAAAPAPDITTLTNGDSGSRQTGTVDHTDRRRESQRIRNAFRQHMRS